MNQTEFRAYILRQLGYPIHNVELTTDQLNDAITNAVDRFTERHYDATIMNVYKLQLTNGVSSYDLPASIKTVINVYPGNNIFSSMSESENMLIPVMPMPYQDYLWKLSDVSSIMTWRMGVKTWEDSVSNQNLIFDFNYSMHKFTLLGDIQRIMASYPNNANCLALQVYECADADAGDLFSNRWLKQYATALAKRQWATNLKKFNGIPLPGGGDLNHEGIMSDANDELTRLEEQLDDEFTMPPSFIIG